MTPPRRAHENGYLVVAAGSGAVAGIGCAMSLENDPRTPPPLPPDLEDQLQVTSTGRTS